MFNAMLRYATLHYAKFNATLFLRFYMEWKHGRLQKRRPTG